MPLDITSKSYMTLAKKWKRNTFVDDFVVFLFFFFFLSYIIYTWISLNCCWLIYFKLFILFRFFYISILKFYLVFFFFFILVLNIKFNMSNIRVLHFALNQKPQFYFEYFEDLPDIFGKDKCIGKNWLKKISNKITSNIFSINSLFLIDSFSHSFDKWWIFVFKVVVFLSIILQFIQFLSHLETKKKQCDFGKLFP